MSADRFQVALLREAGMGRRAALFRSLSGSVIAFSRAAIRRCHPGYTERDVLLAWAEVHYGADLAGKLRGYLERRAHEPT